MGKSRRQAGTPSSVLSAEVDALAAVVQHGQCWGSEGGVSANHSEDCGCCQPIPWGSDFWAGAQGKVVHGLEEILYFLFRLL